MIDSLWSVDFAPRPGRPRSSEGAFLTLNGGDILFCFTAFSGKRARDFTTADIACMRSQDGGRTWSEETVLFTARGHGAMNIMSVSLLRMGDGSIGLFYLVRKNWQEMRPVLRRSNDEGKTWSEPAFCVPRDGYFVMNNDRAVRLSSGRIVLPLAEHKVVMGADGQPAFGPAESCFALSDDDGHTWRESADRLDIHATGSPAGLQEPGVVELQNGVLYGWARTELGLQYDFASQDSAVSWSLPRPSRFTSPLSPMSVKRLGDGRLMAVWNPIPEYNTRHSDRRTGGRTPLCAAVSADDGQTWSDAVPVEDDPFSGYCYTAIHPVEGGALLAYCAGEAERDRSCLNRLRIRRLAVGRAEKRGADTPNPMGIGFDEERLEEGGFSE